MPSFVRLSRRILKSLPLLLFFFAVTLSAQSTGPLTPPPATGPAPSAPGGTTPKPAPRKTTESPVTNEPPSIPTDQIIKKFAEREVELKNVLNSYTWTQHFLLQTLDSDDVPDGEYEIESDVLFDAAGRRIDKVTYAPGNTLKRILLTQQDLDDLKKIQPFSFTGDELPKYNITYVGRQKIDELSTYVFDVAPKVIEKNQRYFQGRLWVDDKDIQIVKTHGKAVPDIIKKNQENLFPRFTTYRENLFGDLWLPTYTRTDDTLRFREGPVHLVATVRYTNYKRFGSTTKIGVGTEAPPQ
ncbi:MAG TPA: hypothetical protein VN025_08260 [Candidatus Dormibacteraeota bacterium]|nr:hypothetical protein [Candidatus Dormibacteraeota bacterium]